MSPKKFHLLLARSGFADLLAEELQDTRGLPAEVVTDGAVALPEAAKAPPPSDTIFGRQLLPLASRMDEPDTDAAAAQILARLEVMAQRANRQTGAWTLHVFGLDDDVAVARAAKLEKAVLARVKERLPRLMKRYLTPAAAVKEPRSAHDILVQVYLDGDRTLWLSTATFATGVSPYIAGNRRLREREGAPSRSAKKLEEAFLELGSKPTSGETAVDLGAAPGGWTFALARHGAVVTAVDHGALDLPKDQTLTKRVTHLEENGLKYRPPGPVDWMTCDMLVSPKETLAVLDEWLRDGLMSRFVVNIKLPQGRPWPIIQQAAALLRAHPWAVMKARHLYHDRREITLMGRRA